MLSLDVQTQFAFAEKLEITFGALVFSFLVMHCPCVNLKCKISLENLFAQFTLQEFNNVFMREFDVILEHVKCFKSQIAFLAGKSSLAVMHPHVALQSLFAGENLRALLTIDCSLGLLLHVRPQLFIGEVHLSTVGTDKT